MLAKKLKSVNLEKEKLCKNKSIGTRYLRKE